MKNIKRWLSGTCRLCRAAGPDFPEERVYCPEVQRLEAQQRRAYQRARTSGGEAAWEWYYTARELTAAHTPHLFERASR